MSAKPQKSGEPLRFQTLQLLPSGRELPVEYTTVSLGKKAGFVAIGRNLENVSDLQSRLVDALKAREQDFWRLREIEQRYRAVLDATERGHGAGARLEPAHRRDQRPATRSLGLLPGAEFLPDLSARDRKALEAALELARSQGRAPNIVLHLPNGSQWSLRASLLTSDVRRLLSAADVAARSGARKPTRNPTASNRFWRRLPDAFVLVDRDGAILKANPTFLDLAQVGVEAAALGQNIRRWLSHPGEDFPVIAGLVHRHGSVRMLRCRLEGELGSVTPVEISAVGDRRPVPRRSDLVMRDVSPRESQTPLGSGTDLVDLTHGLALPKDTLEDDRQGVGRDDRAPHLEEALTNRRVTARSRRRRLGLSRQTLHVKLNKYKLDRRLT